MGWNDKLIFFRICWKPPKTLTFRFEKKDPMRTRAIVYFTGILCLAFTGWIAPAAKAQPFLDACFTSPTVGTSFASTANVTNNNADLLRWTGAAWTGGWGGANITLAPPGAIVNTRGIWSGDGTVWTTGGEGFGLRLTSPIVTETTYTFAFQRVSHGTGQNGNFAPILYTNAGGSFGTSYGAIPGVGTSWTNSNITFTATAGSSGHTFVYFHNNVGSGLFLACTTVILPMAFSDLQAFPNGDRIHLQWHVQDETNYQQHAVERSLNGIEFDAIGSVASVAAGLEGHFYEYADPVNGLPSGQRLYYRIRSIDQEGLEALSPVVETTVTTESSFRLAVYPNPTRQGTQANVIFYSATQGDAAFSILDVAGKLVDESVCDVQNGRNTLPIHIERLAPGMYLIRLQMGGKSAFSRLVIE